MKDRWNEIFPFIVSAPCEELRLSKNEWFISEDWNVHEEIINEISQTNFMHLRGLTLCKFMIKTGMNNIESIEQLQFMNMPLLEKLSLCETFDKSGKNNITNVSALNKCAWSSLRYLSLSSYLIYGQVITKCKNSILQEWRFSKRLKTNWPNKVRKPWSFKISLRDRTCLQN